MVTNKNNVLSRLRKLDPLPKGAIIVLMSVLVYAFLLIILKPLFINPDLPGSHTTMMGDYVMSFQNSDETNFNITAIIGGIIAGCITALILGQREEIELKDDKLTIIKQVLSPDEQKIITVIEETKEITQDSLTFRLGWSRAKISVILTNLERRNIVQRKREGKTYVVFLSER